MEENLYVFVDVAELPPPGEGHAVPLRWGWRVNWRNALDSLGPEMGALGGSESLDVYLQSDSEVLLVEVLPEVEDANASNEPGLDSSAGGGDSQL